MWGESLGLSSSSSAPATPRADTGISADATGTKAQLYNQDLQHHITRFVDEHKDHWAGDCHSKPCQYHLYQHHQQPEMAKQAGWKGDAQQSHSRAVAGLIIPIKTEIKPKDSR